MRITHFFWQKSGQRKSSPQNKTSSNDTSFDEGSNGVSHRPKLNDRSLQQSQDSAYITPIPRDGHMIAEYLHLFKFELKFRHRIHKKNRKILKKGIAKELNLNKRRPIEAAKIFQLKTQEISLESPLLSFIAGNR